MKTYKLLAFGLSILGLFLGIYTGVWVASGVERFYAPTVSGSDELDLIFTRTMIISCVALGAVLSFFGYRIGTHFASKYNHKHLGSNIEFPNE